MNKIILPVNELKTALVGLGKVANKRASLPVLQHVRIERLADGASTISATDLDSSASYRFEQGSEGKAESVLVPFESLNSIVKRSAADENITIEKPSANRAIIHYPIGAGSADRHVESLPSEEWPPPPKINGEGVLLDGAFRSALWEALKCVSTDETRYVLRGAYVDVSEELSNYVVATDARHLYSSNSFHVPLKTSVIIPDRRFLAWKGFGQDGDWLLRVETDKGQPVFVEITSFRWTFVTKPIEGKFPNWRQVLPDLSGLKTSVTIPANALDEFIEIIGKLPCDEINRPIGLKLDRGGKLILFGRAARTDKLTEVGFSAAEVKGGPVTVCLSRNYLAKALRFGLSEIQIGDALSAMRCTDHSGRQLVIMPIRMDGVTPKTPIQPQPTPPPPKLAESSTTRNNTMQTTNRNGGQPAAAVAAKNSKSAIETAVDQVDTAKAAIGTALGSLNAVLRTLRQAQREQRGTEKEIQSVRSTLQSLQRVKI